MRLNQWWGETDQWWGETDLEKAEMVCSMPGLGDRKPSSLMDSMHGSL